MTASDGATRAATRKRVAEALIDVAVPGNGEWLTNGSRARIADALLAAGVFREPPTIAEIATVLTKCGAQRQIDEWPERYRIRQAQAVRALFGGDSE